MIEILVKRLPVPAQLALFIGGWLLAAFASEFPARWRILGLMSGILLVVATGLGLLLPLLFRYASAGLGQWRLRTPIARREAITPSEDPEKFLYIGGVYAELDQLSRYSIRLGITIFNGTPYQLAFRYRAGKIGFTGADGSAIELPSPFLEFYSSSPAQPYKEFSFVIVQPLPGDLALAIESQVNAGRTLELALHGIQLLADDASGRVEKVALGFGRTWPFIHIQRHGSRIVTTKLLKLGVADTLIVDATTKR